MGSEPIERGAWRFGKTCRYLIQRDGTYYAAWVRIHFEEGIQASGDTVFEEVVPVTKTVTVWVKAT